MCDDGRESHWNEAVDSFKITESDIPTKSDVMMMWTDLARSWTEKGGRRLVPQWVSNCLTGGSESLAL